MQKWIQHAEKPPGHLDYTETITLIYGSNNFSMDFGKISSEKGKNVERLDYDLINKAWCECNKCKRTY
jgi:hypothetical protein